MEHEEEKEEEGDNSNKDKNEDKLLNKQMKTNLHCQITLLSNKSCAMYLKKYRGIHINEGKTHTLFDTPGSFI